MKISTNPPKIPDRGIMSAVMDKFFGPRLAAAEQARKITGVITLPMDMRPRMQPFGSRLYARFAYVSRFDMFYVFLFQDRPDMPPRRDIGSPQRGDASPWLVDPT